MANEVQEIKSRLSVEEVIGEYVPLTKAGTNFKACCPFHSEKSPSFMISPQKQIWHCFGCGEGGDIFTFIEKIENVDFAESLRILAKKAGVVLRKSNPKLRSEKNLLMEITAWAQKYFYTQLLKNRQAELAKDYLKNRDITKQSVVDFGIGYSLSGWDALLSFLKSRKFKEVDIEKTGLIIKKDRGGYYDRFRERVIFPIRNVNGEVIGFGGRILKKDEKSAKYINSPQSLIYNKSQVVYGLYEAKQAIKEKGFVIVVEGYMDVIMNHQVGIKNVIASSGTAFTREQIQLLKRYTDTLLFCFDADAAGQAALLRGIDAALLQGMKIKVISIPQGYGKDPDECIKKNVDVWKQSIQDAVPIVQYYITKKLSDLRTKSPAEQSERVRFILEILQKVQDSIEQSYWLQEVSRRSGLEIHILQEQLREIGNGLPLQKDQAKKDVHRQSAVQPVAEENEQMALYKQLFSLIILIPQAVGYIEEHLEARMIMHELYQALYKSLINFYNSREQIVPTLNDGTFDYLKLVDFTSEPHQPDEEFTRILKNIGKDRLQQAFDRLALQAQDHYIGVSQDELRYELKLLLHRIKELYVKVRIDDISQELEKEHDVDKITQLSQEFNLLMNYVKEKND